MPGGGFGQNDVRVRFVGDASALEQTIQGLMQQIEQLRQQAGSINIGGGRGGVGGNTTGGVSSGAGMAMRSAMPAPTPIGTPGRGTSATTRAVSAGPSAATMMLTQSLIPTQPMPTQPTVQMPPWALPGGQPGPWGGMQSAYQRAMGYRGVLNMSMDAGLNLGFAGLEAATLYSQYQQAAIQRVMTNRPDIMGEAGLQGSLIGGGLGAGVGFLLGGPLLASFGAGIGATFGSSTFQRWAAPEERAAKTAAMLLGAGGLRSSLGGWFMDTQAVGESSPFDPAGRGRVGRVPTAMGSAQHLQTWVKGLAGRAVFSDPNFNPSEDDIAQSYASIQESLIAGGVDPNRLTGGRTPIRIGAGTYRLSGSSRLMDRFIDAAGVAAAAGRPGWTQEELAMHITENLTQRYGRATPEVAGQVAPILSSLPETESNLVDIMRRFGAGATSRFVEGLTEPGQPASVNVRSLMETDTRFRRLERERAFISLRHRGVGEQMESLYGDQMAALSALPEGRASLAFAEVQSRRRDAMFRRFEEEDTVNFSIPMARLSGERERARLSPFASGSAYGMELRNIGLWSGQLSTWEKRLADLKGAGQLSEQQELGLVGQIEGARTQVAASVATLSEGMEQYLPALMAGRAAWSGRFNTANMAALRLGRIGSLSREFGAMGGGQLRGQDALFASFGVSSNYGSVGSPHSSGEVLALLRRIAMALEGGNGSGARPAEARGANSAAARRSGVDPSALNSHAN